MRTNVSAGIRVLGVTAEGDRVVTAGLNHGEHPEVVIGKGGWSVDAPETAELGPDGALELTYAVSPLSGPPPAAREATRRDADIAAGEVGEAHQRVGAYAMVHGAPGVLLTQFNSQTAIPGNWGLPGGGLDEGESPVDGVHREVWEETGQRIVLGSLVTVQSQHWVGRAPSGAVEDFHAVRIVYRATCPEPTEIVIHDVGGTTSAARWVAQDELGGLSMTASWRDLTELYGSQRPPRPPR
ncbi:MAG: NUDIX domain-containing protein [Terracoccus sp.]